MTSNSGRSHRIRKSAIAALAAAVALCILLPASAVAVNEISQAPDLTRESKITSDNGSTARLQDKNQGTAWKAGKGESAVTIKIPDGESPGGLYISWSVRPAAWRVQYSSDGEAWTDGYIGSGDGPRDQYVSLEGMAGRTLELPMAPDGCEGVREALCRYVRLVMESGSKPAAIYELRVLGAGSVPDGIERWKPSAAKVDLMIFSAHPDDETVFFGGVLPTYAGEQGRSAAVVYMTNGNVSREAEALGAIWTSGVETYPVFGSFPDTLTKTHKEGARVWGGEEAVLEFVVEQIRRFRPEVVVTHDVNGEYVHGAHIITAWAVQQAMTAAADPAQFPGSAQQYGVWQVKKCYLHLYPENKIVMDWDIPLNRFGGRTALDVAQEALQHHASQLHWPVVRVHVVGNSKYPCTHYGLYFTTVGPDTAGGDFFENIP